MLASKPLSHSIPLHSARAADRAIHEVQAVDDHALLPFPRPRRLPEPCGFDEAAARAIKGRKDRGVPMPAADGSAAQASSTARSSPCVRSRRRASTVSPRTSVDDPWLAGTPRHPYTRSTGFHQQAAQPLKGILFAVARAYSSRCQGNRSRSTRPLGSMNKVKYV